MWLNRAAAAAAMAGLAACASAVPQRMNVNAPQERGADRCESAVATATMFSKTSAIHYAKARLAEEIGETKSELNATPGVVSRAGETAVQCEPYSILGQSTSLYNCVASTQVCVR